MKVTRYTWSRYIKSEKLMQRKNKYHKLFAIRDALLSAENDQKDKTIITFTRTSDDNEILGIAGSLHYWWVIDFVLESNNQVSLLYRNCRVHKDTDPNLLWEETLQRKELLHHVEPN